MAVRYYIIICVNQQDLEKESYSASVRLWGVGSLGVHVGPQIGMNQNEPQTDSGTPVLETDPVPILEHSQKHKDITLRVIKTQIYVFLTLFLTLLYVCRS